MEWIDLKEFVEKGYLQEANRLFFHPLGLSLAITIDESGDSVGIQGILDCRDDPEGVLFGPSFTPEQANMRESKAETIKAEMAKRLKYRTDNLGFDVQPVERLKTLAQGGIKGH